MYYKVWIRKNIPTYSKYNFKLFFLWNEAPDFSPASHRNTIWLPLNYCLDICLLEKWMFCHLLGHKSIIRKSNTCKTFLLSRLVQELLLCKKKGYFNNLKVDWPLHFDTFLPVLPHFLWFRIQYLRAFFNFLTILPTSCARFLRWYMYENACLSWPFFVYFQISNFFAGICAQ